MNRRRFLFSYSVNVYIVSPKNTTRSQARRKASHTSIPTAFYAYLKRNYIIVSKFQNELNLRLFYLSNVTKIEMFGSKLTEKLRGHRLNFAPIEGHSDMAEAESLAITRYFISTVYPVLCTMSVGS